MEKMRSFFFVGTNTFLSGKYAILVINNTTLLSPEE
jgi:hypothetical protein